MDQTKSKANTLLTIIISIACLIGAVYFYYLNIDVNNNLLSNELTISNVQYEISTKELELEKLNTTFNELQTTYNAQQELIKECANNKQIFFDNILKLESKIVNREANIKIAYLTIDDGPNAGTTEQWLDILKQYDVLATFFVNKKEWCEDEYKAMISNHHTIANHTASHNFSYAYKTSDNMVADLKDNHDYLLNNYGVDVDIMRFPGGSGEIKYLGHDKTEYVTKVKEAGYGYIDWNVSSGDGNRNQSANTFLNNVLRDAPYTYIATVLMHDDSVNTIKALPKIIEGLQDRGFILLPLQKDSYVIK